MLCKRRFNALLLSNEIIGFGFGFNISFLGLDYLEKSFYDFGARTNY